MPRIARIVAIGLPHHITQRGNYQQNIFHDDTDRKQYLSWVQEYSEKYELTILAYCLMQNHVHFIAIPNKEDSLAKTFNTSHMRYSQYFNKKMKVKGHLWQGRFYSCVLDETHLIAATKYIERNPVRVNAVSMPWEWKWSSALSHIDNKNKSLIKIGNLFEFIEMSCDSWKEYIFFEEDRKKLEEIRKHTLTGRPLGTTQFIEKLEKIFDKKFSVLPRGRKKVAVPI